MKDFFSNLKGRLGLGYNNSDVYDTPYGKLNLAKASDRQRAKGLIAGLIQNTQTLTRRDIGEWRKAWQMAINVENPVRHPLINIYTDTDIDLHLTGCVGQRNGFVKARSYKLEDKNGKENPEAKKLFEAEWFTDLVDYILQANYWGHSLVELGDVITLADGTRAYERVSIIPRQHVIPDFGRVVVQVGDEPKKGIDYRNSPLSQWLVEIGKPKELGIYLKASTQTIPKRNMLGFWDTFGETFGMPMRVGTVTSRDERDIQQMEAMLRNMASNLWALFPEGMDFQLIETNRQDAYNVYDRRIDRANSELSKLVVGQTMTIEDGSSLSQSETHLTVFENLVDSDCTLIQNVVNTQLLPRMLMHGFPVAGLRFVWDYSKDYTPEQQIAYETAIADRYEVDPEYFAEKYSMPVGKPKQHAVAGNANFFD